MWVNADPLYLDLFMTFMALLWSIAKLMLLMVRIAFGWNSLFACAPRTMRILCSLSIGLDVVSLDVADVDAPGLRESTGRFFVGWCGW